MTDRDPRCPLCGRADARPSERHERFTLYVCGRCDLQFSDPMEEAGRGFYEEDALYAGIETRFASPAVLNWDQRRFLRDAPSSGGALLDVGCGTGQFAAAARRVGYRVTAIDLSRSQIALACTHFPDIAFEATALADFARAAPPASFDVVTAFQVLEHVADPAGFLALIRSMLRPDGFLALGVPNWRTWPVLRDPLDAPPNHLTRWSVASLSVALHRAGFEPVRVLEHRSAYNFLLRRLRLGLVRRAMRRTPPVSADRGPASRRALVARRAVVSLIAAKTTMLRALDVPAGALLTLWRAPGVELYALARVRG
jgi:SAM-dependent methyltransferase